MKKWNDVFLFPKQTVVDTLEDLSFSDLPFAAKENARLLRPSYVQPGMEKPPYFSLAKEEFLIGKKI